MKTAEIRSEFLAFFAEKSHAVVPSAPLVPRNDPTLLFVNAGMVPFKEIFTGAARADSPRAASSQRCLRVSGKHNDLEEVGRTPRHHTLFEMLGNFSFGDYFKEPAIELAYEFLVGRLGLDPDRLVYTVFGGEEGIPADDEAAEIWKRVTGVGEGRVLRFGMSENFWSMGDTGPCGPCSEIHYDLGPGLSGTVNDGDRWMEIWNLVFMQYDRSAAGKRTDLPAPSIDTGMGLERIASVVQGKTSNYEIDLFADLLGTIAGVAGRKYAADGGEEAVSMRVIADHARATAFLLADDVRPDRTGRGYVLRKIMRRAISHGVLLGIDRPFLAGVTTAVVDAMAEAHPVLGERAAAVKEGAETEEALFRRTVDEGMRRIDDLLDQLENDEIWSEGPQGQRVLSGGRRVPSLRHLRVSAGAHRLGGRAARLRGRRAGVLLGHAGPEGEKPGQLEGRVRRRRRDRLVLRPAPEGDRPHRVPRLRGAGGGLGDRRAGARRRGGAHRGEPGRRGCLGGRRHRAHSVLRRVGRPGGRHGSARDRRREDPRGGHPQGGGRRSHHPLRDRGGGGDRGRQPGHPAGGRRPGAATSRGITAPRISCITRFARCWAITSRRRVRGSVPIACASTSVTGHRWR